jgi:hypothetical protein
MLVRFPGWLQEPFSCIGSIPVFSTHVSCCPNSEAASHVLKVNAPYTGGLGCKHY